MFKRHIHINRLRRSKNRFALEPLNNSIRNELKLPLSLAFAKHVEHLTPVETIPGDGVENRFFDLCGDQLPKSPASRFPLADHSRPIIADSIERSTFDQQSKEQLAQQINLRQRQASRYTQAVGIEQTFKSLDQQFHLPAHPIKLKDHFGRQLTGRDAGQDQQPVTQRQRSLLENLAVLFRRSLGATTG